MTETVSDYLALIKERDAAVKDAAQLKKLLRAALQESNKQLGPYNTVATLIFNGLKTAKR